MREVELDVMVVGRGGGGNGGEEVGGERGRRGEGGACCSGGRLDCWGLGYGGEGMW